MVRIAQACAARVELATRAVNIGRNARQARTARPRALLTLGCRDVRSALTDRTMDTGETSLGGIGTTRLEGIAPRQTPERTVSTADAHRSLVAGLLVGAKRNTVAASGIRPRRPAERVVPTVIESQRVPVGARLSVRDRIRVDRNANRAFGDGPYRGVAAPVVRALVAIWAVLTGG